MRLRRAARLLWVLLFAGLAGWAVFAGLQLRRARDTGDAMAERLAAGWPEDGQPRFGMRQNLLEAAMNVSDGDFRAATADLRPAEQPLSKKVLDQRKAAAQRFFAGEEEARARYIAVATSAEMVEQGGTDAGAIRFALARALTAAAEGDRAKTIAAVELAESALEASDTAGAAIGDGPAAVARWVQTIGPAFNLGRDLMTEGHAAAEKLVARASAHAKAREYKRAASLIRLAAELLAVELAPPISSATPGWFNELKPRVSDCIEPSQAAAAVELCETMAGSSSGGPIATMCNRARRELIAGRVCEAHWWASVALNALGMTDEAIAAETMPR